MRTRAAALASAALASAALLAVALAVTGCTTAPDVAPDEVSPDVVAVMESHGLAGLDAREIIERLDTTPVSERPDDLIASVRPAEIVITAASGVETSVPMPEDAFYVSIAPFVEHTHDCFFHSLTTCRGELADAELQVTVTDGDAVLFDERVRTYDNGFVGLWLPRDIEGEITVTGEGGSVTAPLSTGADAPTCVTTLQLS